MNSIAISNSIFPGHFEWLEIKNFSSDSQWWAIYEEAFPLAERDSSQQLSFALKSNIAKLGCFRIDNEITAIAVIYKMQNPAFAFLHYFAVSKPWRNKRLGTQLFLELISETDKIVANENQKSLGLIWEVEDPTQADNEIDKQMQMKRMQFYDRLGGKLLNGKFIQPAINGCDYVPMRLMSHSKENHLPAKLIAKAIYFEKYAVVNKINGGELSSLLEKCFKE